MTQAEKAVEYDKLVRRGDAVNRDISKLQSQNAGVNTKSEEYNTELNRLRGIMNGLEAKMAGLFTGM
jgi:hypothetical protein